LLAFIFSLFGWLLVGHRKIGLKHGIGYHVFVIFGKVAGQFL
jgi:hypothetical protein